MSEADNEDVVDLEREFHVKKREQLFAQLQKTYDASSQVAPGSISNFLARCDDLNKIKEKFELVQDKLIQVNLRLPTAEQVSVDQVKDSFNDIYYKIRAIQNDLRSRMSMNAPPPVTSSLEMRLPKIELPTWTGDLLTFQNYWTMFNSMVHRGNFDDVIKLTYLRKSLEGTPLALIQNLELSDRNYQTAYNLINDKYGNTRALGACYVNKMLEFAPLKSCSQKELQLFLDTFSTTYQAFCNLDLPDGNNFVLFQCALRVLPTQIRLLFERSLTSRLIIPTFGQLIQFVEDQCNIEEFVKPIAPSSIGLSSNAKTYHVNKNFRHSQSLLVAPEAAATSNSQPHCVICESNCAHIYCCPLFSQLSLNDKYERLKELRRCFRCLGSHLRSRCTSRGVCKQCHSASHHTSLHEDRGPTADKHESISAFNVGHHRPTSDCTPSENVAGSNPCPSFTLFTSPVAERPARTVLLGTAQALIVNKHGKLEPIRLVIDGGSQVCLISSECVQRLSLPIINKITNISGALAQRVGSSRGVVSCTLFSRLFRSRPLTAEAVVVKNVCAELPNVPIPVDVYEQFKHLNLADRSFHEKGKIDFLLGASLYSDIFHNQSQIIHGEPAAFETIFGFVMMGNVPLTPPESTPEVSLFMCDQDLNTTLKSFWEVEEGSPRTVGDPLHIQAENHFVATHSRRPDGSYIVRLPFNPTVDRPFGDSESIARRRWFNLENKLRKNSKLRNAYNDFMVEYRDLEHMAIIKEPGMFYLPHFAIIRDSPTSPIRVVFDGSCRDSSGLSLNDHLLTGPPLQKDICDVIAFFRLKPIAFTTDIKMMYRRIWLHPDDTKYQCIKWRESEEEPLLAYRLNTVTYGLSCAPFLAQRVLQQLVRDEGHLFPLASQVIMSSCYMDDICTSVSTVDEARRLRQELIELMNLGGFELRKWASNSSDVLEGIPREHCVKSLSLQSPESRSLHILGIEWTPINDVFTYSVKIVPEVSTKRLVLSQIASVFDPLGWISPVVFRAKLFLREIWECRLDWDDVLPPSILSRWAAFSAQLSQLSNIKFPRLLLNPELPNHHIIGFCDASSLGYAAAVYVRCSSDDGREVTVRLLRAKTRVAPLKVLTIPRLELNGAVLLSKLLQMVQPVLQHINVKGTYLFSDSSVVLAWLKTPPHLLQTYVANRIVSILEITQINQWHHVVTTSNVADVASRGLYPEEIIYHPSWWTGPSFLCSPIRDWPITKEIHLDEGLPELRSKVQVLLTTPKVYQHDPSFLVSVINRYSTLNRLKRVMAWGLRFIHNCRQRKKDEVLGRTTGPLTPAELRSSLLTCIIATQQFYFKSELASIAGGKPLPSSMARLTPFLKNGVMRVGGRLSQSLLPTDAKHPIILPKLCHLSVLICDDTHINLLHAGPQACQAVICQEFWIISLRSLLRQRIFRCMTCHRYRIKPDHPLMADLPASRVTPSYPFEKTAVDYAGPLYIRANNLRNARKVKVYICLFVCMATKAVHLELAGDLSSESYIAALSRFIARRGLCTDIFCDNGTNFRGAHNESREILQALRSSYPHVADYLSSKEIHYHFNPPSAPWMGGLWESAVKAAKNRLRDLSQRLLTFEEMSTLLARIEAILNSRPLCPLGTSPDSLYLTPGHFLVGRSLVQPLEPDLLDLPTSHLSRWQGVQQAAQRFWRIWSTRYLHTLMERQKWSTPRPPLNIGDVVIILRSQSRPMEWPLGRVMELHEGADGVARSATVQTAQGVLVRPVARLARLPPETNTNNGI